MNKDQATTLIRGTFEDAFHEARYLRFVQELLNGQLDESDDRKFDYYGQYIPDSFKESVQRYKRLGTYTDPNGEVIDFLVVTLKQTNSLDRARTMQRNFAAYHLKHREKETAIIAYITPDKTDWRFSMVRRQEQVGFNEKGKLTTQDDLTPVRRYSFLVGKNERSHTAQQQLFPILLDDKNDPTLARLEQAFNIETVTKEFFERYKTLFLQLKESLDQLVKSHPRVQSEFTSKALDTANFAKKLLGQLVFLYFLQKKGWLGVPLTGNWGDGSKRFLRNLWEGGKYANFFNDVLEPLFYEALAIERPDNHYPRLNVRIPFLNGGLFEPMNNYDWKQIDILIDNRIFEDIFQTFDLYNFTVREDEPLEKEVAVDPEMLGKVFENLLEVTDRKSKGAFYTPREIVHYMCQESLIHYLDTQVNVGQKPLVEGNQPRLLPPVDGEQLPLMAGTAPMQLIPRTDIATFIRFGEFAKEHDATTQGKDKETETYSFRMPESIRIHAPALDEALASIKICDPAIGSGAFPVGMLQEIIKARHVLTTYLAEDPARSLYHFKRHAIQESIYGVDIDPGAIDIAKLRLWLSLVVDEEDYQHIKPLPNLDYKIVCGNSLLAYPYERRGLEKLERLKTRFFDETRPDEKNNLRQQIDATLKDIFADTPKALGYQVKVDFRINFSEVFRGRGGFDVVIGNPPYVRQELIKEYKKAFEKGYPEVYAGTADLFVYFFAQGFNVLNKGGVLAFITSNKFMRANYGKALRAYLANKTSLQTLIDFGELPVFDAGADPLITIGRRQAPDEHHLIQVLQVTSLDILSTLYRAVAHADSLPQKTLSGVGWHFSRQEVHNLMDKLKRSGQPLGEYVNGAIYRGVTTGYNEAFVIDRETRKKLIDADPRSAEVIKQLVVGDDVRKWRSSFPERYLIFTRRGINIEQYPAVKAHLLKHYDALSKKAGGNQWYELQTSVSYYLGFEKPKILYPEMCKESRFTCDPTGSYAMDTCFIIPSADLYLIGILNSDIVWEYLKRTCAVLGDVNHGGRLRLKKIFTETIPIPNAPEAVRERIRQRVTQIMQTQAEIEQNTGNVAMLRERLREHEAQLNALVYQAYGLTEDEIALVEG